MGKASTHIGAAIWFLWYVVRSIKENKQENK
jgi:hypothetical protein